MNFSFEAIPYFLSSALDSRWGIVYIAIFFLFGQLFLHFFGRYGGVVAVAGILGLAAYQGGQGPDALAAYTRSFTVDPAAIISDHLARSAKNYATSGVAIIILGLTIAFLQHPLTTELLIASRRFRVSVAHGNRFYGYSLSRAAAVFAFLLTITLGSLIALWVALLREPVAFDRSFPLMGLADLALPNWQPVWSFPYLLVAALAGLVVVCHGVIGRQLDLSISNRSRASAAWPVILTMLVALILPVGVTLFALSMMIGWMILAPLAALHIRSFS